MKSYIFKRGVSDDFMYVYSPNCKAYKEFTIRDGCICNGYNGEINDWDYISIVTKEKYSQGTIIKTKCSFEKYGAPLIVFSDDISKVDGVLKYGHHYEVVAYENGINIWSIDPMPENPERPIKTKKIGFIEFSINAGDIIELEVKIGENKIMASIGEYKIEAEDERVPSNFHVGITACEGKNFFTELTIQ